MINESKVRRIQAKINSLVNEIEKEENVSINFGSVTYNSAYYTTSMKVTTKEKNEKTDNVFEALCKSIGFTQNVIGMEFKLRGNSYKITSIKTRNRKYPVIADNLDNGNTYKFTVDHVKKLIGGDKIINRNANLDKLI